MVELSKFNDFANVLLGACATAVCGGGGDMAMRLLETKQKVVFCRFDWKIMKIDWFKCGVPPTD